MKDNFTEYLSNLGMGDAFLKRVAELHEQCRLLVKTEFDDIFISEQLVQGRRTYVAVHFFTDYYVVRCKNFIETFFVEMRHLERISSCDFAHRDFDLKTLEVTDRSVFQVNPRWEPTSFSLQLWATGANCRCLFEIVNKYILPKINTA
jgi:hypothetical protein